ncbi:MAG: sulfotransferase family protein, partial [Planctomycetota bacterium]
IEPETDCFNLYHRIDGRCLMDAAHAEPEIRVRFARVMLPTLRRSGKKLLIEKTPINAMRIGFLEALASRARYVHIVRDGVDVCRSIERIATASTYTMGGKPTMNQWWAVDNVKWASLLRDGTAAGYHADEARQLQGHLAMGAYEWIVSLLEVDRKREALGDRLLEIRYPDLTEDPGAVLAKICGFLDLDAPQDWLLEAGKIVGPARRHEGPDVVLPESMCRAFNAFQQRFGFANRAVPAPSGLRMP